MFTPAAQPQAQPQLQPQPQQAQPEQQAPPSPSPLAVDQLNQHVLLTVQAINQATAVVTVRGA